MPGRLNASGIIADNCLLKIQKFNPAVAIDKYVIMPNHVHAILAVNENSPSITTVIGQYKSAVTKRIREIYPRKNVWQRSFHDHVIRDQRGYEKIWMYIEDNPRKWEEDCFYRAE